VDPFGSTHGVLRTCVTACVDATFANDRDGNHDLARRLRPGLTLEDVANPHDFPELADPDWQYEDGLLAGVQSVLAAVRARRREGEA